MERLTNSIDFCQMHCDFGKTGGCFFKDKSHCYDNNIYNRLREYEIAEEQGLLLRLPCPIGTTVYSIDRQIWIDEKGCRDCVYYAIDGSCDYEEEYPACTKVFETKFKFNMREDFGKTVFLTKEEAVKALKQMGE